MEGDGGKRPMTAEQYEANHKANKRRSRGTTDGLRLQSDTQHGASYDSSFPGPVPPLQQLYTDDGLNTGLPPIAQHSPSYGPSYHGPVPASLQHGTNDGLNAALPHSDQDFLKKYNIPANNLPTLQDWDGYPLYRRQRNIRSIRYLYEFIYKSSD